MSSRIRLLLILFMFVTSLQSQPPETERPADSEQNSYSLRDLLHSKNNDIASNTDNIVDIEQDHMSNPEDNNSPDTDDNDEAPSDDLLNDQANEYNPNNPEPTNDEQLIEDELIESVDNIYDVEQTHIDIANEEEQTQPIPDMHNTETQQFQPPQTSDDINNDIADHDVSDEKDENKVQPPPHYEYNDRDQNNQESIDDQELMQNVHESDEATPTQTQSIPDVDDIIDLEVIEADNTETEQPQTPQTPQTDTYENNNDVDDGNDDMYNEELLPPPDHASNANINEEYQYQTNPNENSGTGDNYYNEEEIHDHDHDHDHDDGHFHYPDEEYIDEYGEYDPDDDDEFDDEYPEEYYRDPVQVQANEPMDGGMDKKINEDIFEENDEAEQKTSFFDNIMNTIPQILSNMNDIRRKDNNYMELYEQCNAKLNILEKRLSASSIVELNMNNRIGVTFLFVLIDIIICIICYPRKSVLGTFVWMLFWSFLSFMSYTSNRNNPLFIVLAVNAVFPLLTKTSN